MFCLLQKSLLQKILHLIRQFRKRSFVFIIRCFKGRSKQLLEIFCPLPIIAIDSIGKSASITARCEFILTLAEELIQKGYTPHVWLRGMNTKQTRLFNKPRLQEGMSEEAFIISQKIPLWMCRFPENAAIAAAHAGATILLLDGRSDHCDKISQFSIILIEKEIQQDHFSGSLLYAFAHSDALVLLDISDDSNLLSLKQMHQVVYKASWLIETNIEPSTKLVGFTGLHDSGTFYHMLLKYKYNISGFIPLSYSNRHKDKQFHSLLQMAASHKALLITSDKDEPFLPQKMKHHISIFPLKMILDSKLIEQINFVCSSYKDFNSYTNTEDKVHTKTA